MRSTLVGRLNTDNSLAGAGNTITGHSQLVGTFGNKGIVAGEVGTAYNPTYAIVTEAGAQITLYINSSNYQFYAELKDKNGNHIANSNIIDLPLESMVVNGSYDAETKEVVLILDNGNEVRFSVADLVEGLVSTEQLNTILSGYVQFTDYATAAKAGVIKISDTYATAAPSGVLTSQTKTYEQYNSLNNNAFISKGTLENAIVGKELTNKIYVDEADAVFEEDLFGDDIVKDENTELALDTTEAPMKIELKGNTYQDSTTGKNLLNIPDGTQTNNGITFDAQNGEITINGTATGTAFYQGAINIPVTAEKYSWSANNPVSSNGVTLRFNGNAGNVMSKDLVSINETNTTNFETTNTLGYFVIRVTSGTTLTNFKIKPQFEKGDPTSYEPYTNGASPNPDYPQPIQVVSGDNSIVVCGKNRLDMSSISVEAGCTINNGVITSNSLNAWNTFGIKINDIYLEPNVDYYVTFKARRIAGEGTFNYGGRITDGTNWSTQFSVTKPVITNEFQTFCFKINTTLENFVGIKMYFQNSDKVSTLEVKEIIVSKTQDDTYEPYTGASYPINLPVENLVEGIIEKENILSTGLLVIDNNFDLHIAKVTQGETYTITSNDINNGFVGGFFTSYPVHNTYSYNEQRVVSNTYTFTAPITGYVVFRSQTGYEYAQLERGTKRNTFTPYGTTPIEMCSIPNTTYKDTFIRNSGKNLSIEEVKGYMSGDYNWVELDNAKESFVFYAEEGKTYTRSSSAEFNRNTIAKVDTLDIVNHTPVTNLTTNNSDTWTATFTGYAMWYCKNALDTTMENTMMINEGITALPYEPYGTSWYLKKEIGKVVLNGSETWGGDSARGYYCQENSMLRMEHYLNRLYSNYFLTMDRHVSYINKRISGYYSPNQYAGQNWIYILYNEMSTKDDLKTWLSTHVTEVYYVLAAPTYTEITDSTLIQQLNELEKAKSYKGQTNISQENNDEPFILAATAFTDSTAGKLAATAAQINILNETDNTKEDKSNKVATISASSTDTEYPTAKCVYNIVGDIESLLEALDIGSGV